MSMHICLGVLGFVPAPGPSSQRFGLPSPSAQPFTPGGSSEQSSGWWYGLSSHQIMPIKDSKQTTKIMRKESEFLVKLWKIHGKSISSNAHGLIRKGVVKVVVMGVDYDRMYVFNRRRRSPPHTLNIMGRYNLWQLLSVPAVNVHNYISIWWLKASWQ